MEETLNKKIEETTKELGKKSLEYIQKQYSQNNLENHISNVNLKPYNGRYKNGFIISSGDDEVAVYNEFGIGMVGARNSNPLADDAGYDYNVPSLDKGRIPAGAIQQYGEAYCIKVTTPDTWWYFKNGKWWWNRGYKGKQMYSSLVEELEKNAVGEFKVSISQTLGK